MNEFRDMLTDRLEKQRRDLAQSGLDEGGAGQMKERK